MSRIYDNWERLVGATLDREKLRELARAPSLSSSSDFTSHEDDNMYWRLTIANQEGRVRNIVFPLDIETDTFLSVATEMVAELDITDQDVTNIAEMIDSSSDFTSHEDDNIFLRLRIADREGRVRNIVFPFDIETDTFLSVATEMVAELDITDQDVTKIAEMNDSEVASLVPECQRDFGIHESINHTNSNCCQNCALI